MTQALTLYEIEDQLTALIDTAELVPPELLEAFTAELTATNEAALIKRDRCVQFVQHLNVQILFAKQEEERLYQRRKALEAGLERFESYLALVIDRYVPMPPKGPRKMEGRTGELALVRNPGSVEITDSEKVPHQYQVTTLKIKRDLLELLLGKRAIDGWLNRGYILSLTHDIPKSALRAALDAGEEVPGARLADEAYHLRVK